MLAPQKNRAGQRVYRKRDVEIALRIKELLYEDQYTIAGAKKRLANDLRAGGKLRVVSSEDGEDDSEDSIFSRSDSRIRSSLIDQPQNAEQPKIDKLCGKSPRNCASMLACSRVAKK